MMSNYQGNKKNEGFMVGLNDGQFSEFSVSMLPHLISYQWPFSKKHITYQVQYCRDNILLHQTSGRCANPIPKDIF